MSLLRRRRKNQRSNMICSMVKRSAVIPDTNLEHLQNVLDIQLSEGNWNYDAYMHGLANGLILADALIKDEEPEYKEAPEEWIEEMPERVSGGEKRSDKSWYQKPVPEFFEDDLDKGDIVLVDGKQLKVTSYDKTFVNLEDDYGRTYVAYWHEIEDIVEKR